MFRFHYERLTRNWTQRQLGALVGMNQTYVSLLERGRLIPTDRELAALSQALGVSPPSVLMKPVVIETEPAQVMEQSA